MPTRVDIAEQALAGIFQMEQAAGRDAGFLGHALRLVVGAWIGHGFSDVVSDLELAQQREGFLELHQTDLTTLRAIGRDRIADQNIQRAKRDLVRGGDVR